MKLLKNIVFLEKDSFDSYIYKGNISEKKIILMKPKILMNNSGKAINKLVSFYKIPLHKIFIFHDDIDLILPRIKIKVGGSAAGHNGVKSVDMNIGRNYNRIRIGIRNSEEYPETNFYVLENFSQGEIDIIKYKINLLVENIGYLINKDSNRLLNILARA